MILSIISFQFSLNFSVLFHAFYVLTQLALCIHQNLDNISSMSMHLMIHMHCHVIMSEYNIQTISMLKLSSERVQLNQFQ